MAEYRDEEPVYRTDGTAYTTGRPETVVVERRGGGFGRTLAILALLALVVVGLLFLTGFWKLSATGGSMPKVDVSTKGGSMPDVGFKSDKLVVGSKSTTIETPKIETKKTKVDVPVIGVEDKNGK